MFRLKLLSLGAVLALASACGGPISAIATEDHTFTNVGSNPRVVVSSFNGKIDVRTANTNEITARVEKEGRGWSHDDAEDNLDDVSVAFENDGNTYRVTVRVLGHSKDWDHDSGADVELVVPAGTALDLTTDNGDISSTGTNAPVNARSTNGAIDITGGQGAMDLRTTNGAITARPSGAAFASLSTTNGRIAFTGSLLPGVNDFESTNGDITIALPSSSQFEFDASTTNGDAVCEFSYSTIGSSSGSSLRGTVGADSDVQVRARSTNGDVRIRRQ
jgi:DUF4097 and DUF4098 domain-containing protein YvlB